MAKFNGKSAKRTVSSYEGNLQYEKDPLKSWFNFLFSSYLSNRYYENSNTQTNHFLELTEDVANAYGNEFLAKASYFARNKLGLRSVSQLVAAYLNDKQFDSKREYYKNFYHRPDDVAEVFAAIDMLGGKRSHALVRGSADYLSGLSEYTLGKYKMSGKDYNMYDLINITHAHSDVIDAYKTGTLKNPDTWEVIISTSKSKEEKDQNWCNLVANRQLGYLALIRNLCNIIMAAAEQEKGYEFLSTTLASQLVNPVSIEKSLVFPYQIYSAYRALVYKELEITCITQALETAFLYSLKNVPSLDGISCIMLDVSGSMDCSLSYNSSVSIKEVGACFAAMLLLKNPETVVVKFGTNAKVFTNLTKYRYAPFKLIDALCKNSNLGYGTNMQKAFAVLSEYEQQQSDSDNISRIFLISDMQIMGRQTLFEFYNDFSASNSYEKYCNNFGKTYLYSYDLGNYPSQVSNPNNPYVFLATSLSEKVFDFIPYLEEGNNLYDYINSYLYKS